MAPPEKYFGENRTYEVVQLFLSQLSLYFTLSTNIDLNGDIAKYAMAFLDVLRTPGSIIATRGIRIQHTFAKAAVRKKFISFAYIQHAIVSTTR